MSEKTPQNLQHHARSDPWFMSAGIVVYANLIVAVVSLIRRPSFDHGWIVIVSLAASVLALRIRQYPLKVQDRLIRLEERLRLQALAPPAWQTKILLLSEDQLIGLRFASDGEVVALAQQALDEKLGRKQIKERIRVWRPDEWRV